MSAIGLEHTVSNREAVIAAITNILADGAERAKKIKDGIFDFDAELQEAEAEEEFDISEELAESEEDRLLDEEEAEKEKRLDKITSIICGLILFGTMAYLVWYFFLS